MGVWFCVFWFLLVCQVLTIVLRKIGKCMSTGPKNNISFQPWWGRIVFWFLFVPFDCQMLANFLCNVWELLRFIAAGQKKHTCEYFLWFGGF